MALGWAATLVGLSYLTIRAGRPAPLLPLNLCVVIPALLGYELLGRGCLILGVLTVPTVFLAWCWTVLTDGSAQVPRRSLALFAAFALLSFCDLVCGSQYGMQYQGHDYVRAVWLISLAWWAALIALASVARAWPKVWLNLSFHLALFAWLAWYALPYLGELP
jgi:hypothetical protein